jgi:hypothetical protein
MLKSYQKTRRLSIYFVEGVVDRVILTILARRIQLKKFETRAGAGEETRHGRESGPGNALALEQWRRLAYSSMHGPPGAWERRHSAF